MSTTVHPVLLNGCWAKSQATTTFQAVNPTTEETLPGVFPVSPWDEIDAMLQSAADTSREMRGWPGSRFADFLEVYANEIESRADLLVETAHAETALPKSPRLKDGELPRTTNQLRQAAQSARTESWRVPTIDTAAGIRSMLGAMGPVVVFGPNNFPYAYNGSRVVILQPPSLREIRSLPRAIPAIPRRLAFLRKQQSPRFTRPECHPALCS